MRRTIRTHVLKRNLSDQLFETSQTACKHWWSRLNIAVFDGMLIQPARFEIRSMRDCYGWCKPWRPNSHTRRVVIGINDEFINRREFLTILVHEMVHQWEWQMLGDWEFDSDPHGETFFLWQPKIRYRVGLPLEQQY